MVLPPDLVVIIRQFLFEMSDDPFEIRLRDNYELLEDEFKENLKRKSMLNAKVGLSRFTTFKFKLKIF